MQVSIKLDHKNRILKFCVGGEHWQIASPDYFPLAGDNLAAVCHECRAKKRKRVKQTDGSIGQGMR